MPSDEPTPFTLEDLRAAFAAESARHSRRWQPGNIPRDHDILAAGKREMAAQGQSSVSVKWWSIMTMQMRGMNHTEIADALQMSRLSISNIVHTKKYLEAYKSRLDGLDSELYALKPRAVEAMARGLTSQNTDTALRAASEFFKVTGQGTYSRTPDATPGVGAEALARQLLLASKQEVHVHVHQPVSNGSNGTPVDVKASEARSAFASQGSPSQSAFASQVPSSQVPPEGPQLDLQFPEG